MSELSGSNYLSYYFVKRMFEYSVNFVTIKRKQVACEWRKKQQDTMSHLLLFFNFREALLWA